MAVILCNEDRFGQFTKLSTPMTFFLAHYSIKTMHYPDNDARLFNCHSRTNTQHILNCVPHGNEWRHFHGNNEERNKNGWKIATMKLKLKQQNISRTKSINADFNLDTSSHQTFSAVAVAAAISINLIWMSRLKNI